MQCAACGYPLWNLRTRACPECGTAFVPSATRFAPSSVKFCCPHCDQQYFGTDASGHLVPPAFDCVRCGRAVTMDEMVVRPIQGVPIDATRPDEMPWLDRGSRGMAKAWFQTIGRAMVAPASLMRGIAVEVPGRSAWLFMLGSLTIFYLVGMGPASLASMAMMGGMGRMLPAGGGAPFGGLVTFQAASFLLSFVLLVGGAALWVVLAHGLLRLFGGARESANRTWQALGFSSGAAALMAIPCGCGFYPGIIWWLVAGCVMLGVAHPGSGARSTWACIASAVVVAAIQFAVHIAFSVLMLGGSAFALNGPFTSSSQPVVVSGTPLSWSLRQFAQQHGRWPRHGLELLGKPLQPSNFSASGQSSGASAPAVGGTTLEQLDSTPADWSDIASDAASHLPDDIVAHRVGDIVFTFHGVPVDPADPTLWVAVMVPQVTPGATETAAGQAIATCADGQTVIMPTYALPAAVVAQNLARAAAGLPPLPDDLSAVRVDQPARRGAMKGPP